MVSPGRWRLAGLTADAASPLTRPPHPPPHPHTHTLAITTPSTLQVGQDKLNAAFQSMMNDDPKSSQLLDQAQDKFEVRRGPGC